MKIFTIAQNEQLLKNGQPENRNKDHYPVVKLFMPGPTCTWLLTELDPENQNIAFGLCDLGMGFPELGYVELDELLSIKNPLGLYVERDLYFKAKHPLSVYARAAWDNEHIIENEIILAKYVRRK